MADLRDLAPLVMTSVPGCPLPMACDYMRDAFIEVCDRGRVWRFRDEETVDGADPFHELANLPAGTTVVAIERAWFDGRELTPVAYRSLTPTDLEREDAVPCEFTQSLPDRVLLYPRGSGTLTLSLFLKPTEAQIGYTMAIPDFARDRYARLIAAGALARLLALPGKGWTDPGTAAAHAAYFEGELRDLAVKSVTGQQRAPIRARANWF